VISKTSIARETDRRLRHTWMRIGDDVRQLRLDAGVSLRQLGAATGIDPAHLTRIEKGQAHPSFEALTTISVALGANLSMRFYADSGPRIHDRFQAPMIEALLRSIDASWIPRLEVVVPGNLRGVADVVLRHHERPVLVVGEAQCQIRRLEQQMRWINEKADAFRSAYPEQSVSRLLILRSTEATRDIARRFEQTLSTSYPARSIDIFDALTTGSEWPGDGILWSRSSGAVAELLPRPPRGVPVGR
jgi:transcriptional regulator with XRE-family HTH domain